MGWKHLKEVLGVASPRPRHWSMRTKKADGQVEWRHWNGAGEHKMQGDSIMDEKLTRCELSMAGTDVGFVVEARNPYGHHREVAGQIFTKEWSEIHFENSKMGVPANLRGYHRDLGMMKYEQAEALRHWFLAINAMDGYSQPMDTRLVMYTIEHSARVVSSKVVNLIAEDERKEQLKHTLRGT